MLNNKIRNLVFLQDVSKKDLAIAGGKGANLGELLKEGFPIPPGFIIAAKVYESFMHSLGALSITASSKPSDIQAAIIAKELPATIIDDIEIHQLQIQKQSQNPDQEMVYAVRSSATTEDMRDTSFSGQHATYYYVKAPDLPLMIRKCWASLWSDAACSYRTSQGMEHSKVHMAVIVQEMICADVSGVTFTADPLTGDANRIVSQSSWGMGAAIVDGRVSPDQYIVEKSSGKIQAKRISDKKLMVPTSAKEGESRLVEVPFAMRHKETLNDKQVQTLVHWAIQSEKYYSSYQDVEWAFHNDKFYILQSRPITALGARQKEVPKGAYVLFKPLIENFTDPLLPLTQDLLIKLSPLMKIIQGRVYIKINHIRLLMPFKMSNAEVAELAYLNVRDDFKPKISIPRSFLLLVLVLLNHLTFGVLYKRTDNMPNDFMDSFRDKFKAVVENNALDAPAALQHLFLKSNFFDSVGNMPLMVNLIAPRYIILMGALTRLLNWWLPDIRSDAAAYLTAGSSGILSTEMGRQIWQLSEYARQEDEVSAIIRENKSKPALTLLRSTPKARLFLGELDHFLSTHGHRTLKEFELNSARWEEDPAPIIAMIRNYLMSDINPIEVEKLASQKRDLFSQEVKALLSQKPLEKLLGLRWRLVSHLRRRAKYFIRLRENSRFFHIMGFYAIRLKILKLEESLLSQGKLKCKDDIYYLKWHELVSLQRGRLLHSDLEKLMRERRIEHIRLSKLKPDKTFGIKDSNRATDAPVEHDIIRAQGASPGSYEGIARVITDPATDAELHPGEILIAPYTDPAWTPLFLTANAAVIEVGSFLSHAGTIAREYGMPCVVDALDCTIRIKTGDRILVDGSNGTVMLLDEQQIENKAIDAQQQEEEIDA